MESTPKFTVEFSESEAWLTYRAVHQARCTKWLEYSQYSGGETGWNTQEFNRIHREYQELAAVEAKLEDNF